MNTNKSTIKSIRSIPPGHHSVKIELILDKLCEMEKRLDEMQDEINQIHLDKLPIK